MKDKRPLEQTGKAISSKEILEIRQKETMIDFFRDYFYNIKRIISKGKVYHMGSGGFGASEGEMGICRTLEGHLF
ncbi:hypothetical protein V6C32_00345 [Desulforamulus ruminis]|uniref:hypothetical protein n=1 Tax=Desulforamulus ruminis TaxID=1564 RepID=UPI0002EA3F37|nr:hypothetical protein [Desulforamulus ruminis]